MCVSCLVVSDFATPWTHQAPLSMGFSRQEYWSGLPFPLPGNLPHPGSETRISHIVGKLFTIWATRGTLVYVCVYIYAKTYIKIPHTDCFICKYAYKWKENIVKNNGMWKVAKVVTCKTGDWRGKLLLYNFNILLGVLYCFCNYFFIKLVQDKKRK